MHLDDRREGAFALRLVQPRQERCAALLARTGPPILDVAHLDLEARRDCHLIRHASASVPRDRMPSVAAPSNPYVRNGLNILFPVFMVSFRGNGCYSQINVSPIVPCEPRSPCRRLAFESNV